PSITRLPSIRSLSFCGMAVAIESGVAISIGIAIQPGVVSDQYIARCVAVVGCCADGTAHCVSGRGIAV
ncbi:MAG: hypothetical protein AAFN68_13725, partial [Pseudomonadota bacterium]